MLSVELYYKWGWILLTFHYFIGQIELFSHVPVLRNFVDHLKRKNFNVCAVYLLDSQVCLSSASANMHVSDSNLVGMYISLIMHADLSKFFIVSVCHGCY